MAVRNLVRNRKRALMALFTIVVGVICLVLAEGFVHWILWAMQEVAIQSQFAHVQVVRPGYFKAGAADPYRFILPANHPAQKMIEADPGVRLVAPRLKLTGLISHGETSISFVADGVDPAKEAQLSRALRIKEGRDLTAASGREAILGHGLARNLGVGPGDTVALVTSTESGGINAVEVKVAGLFITPSQAYDDAALRLPIGAARALMKTQGAHMWLVLLDDTDTTDQHLERLRTRHPAATSKLEFTPWYVHADFYNKTAQLFSSQMNVLRLIIGFIIVLSISNMLIMNVLERTGEVGTLLAVGFRRRKILRLFAIEGGLLGLAGGLIGVVAGYGLSEMISAIGIPMPPPPGMEEGFTAEIRVTWEVLASAFVLAFATTALAGLYPAWKASRLQIVEALRQNV
jgi:putative ABC transport system permease protein